MRSIKADKSMRFEWGIEIQGIDYKQLQGSLKFIVEDVEYGIPVSINETSIEVDIPPLKNVIKNLANEKIDSKLEIYGDGFYMKPWQEEVKIEIPAEVKVELKENNVNEEKEKKYIKTTTLNEKISTTKIEKPKSIETVKEQDSNPTTKHIEDKVTSKLDEIFGILKNRKQKVVVKEDKKIVPEVKKPIVENYNIEELMESVGLRNEKVKTALMNKVKSIASSKKDQYNAIKMILETKTFQNNDIKIWTK